MIKGLMVVCGLAAGSMSLAVPAYAAHRAVIEFTARIVKTTCSIESDRARVDLGVWSLDDFETLHTTRYADTPMTLRFHGCSDAIRNGITLSVVAAGRQSEAVNRHALWGEADTGVGIDLRAQSEPMAHHRHRKVALTPLHNTLRLEPLPAGDTLLLPAVAPVEVEAGVRRYVVPKAIVPSDIRSALFFTVNYG